MNLEELDRIYKRNNEMILRRAGKAGVKAVTFGSESLDALITDIADAYGLDAADRETLYPFRSVTAADTAQSAISTIATTPIAAEAGRIMLQARESKAVLATGKALLRGGLDAARDVAKGGAVKAGAGMGKASKASKGVPWLTVAVGLYGASTAGWFWARARKYNQACFELLKTRLEAPTEASIPAAKPAPRKKAAATKPATKKPSRSKPQEG